MVCSTLVAGGRLLGAEQQALLMRMREAVRVAQFPSSWMHIHKYSLELLMMGI